MITPERLAEYRHIAPTAGPEGQKAINELLAEVESMACDMRWCEPFDFAWCETHDTTFQLGGTCKFDGREMWEVYADEASAQRQRAVLAEMEIERLQAALNREAEPEKQAEAGPGVEVVDLVAALRASVQAAKERREAAERAWLRGHDA